MASATSKSDQWHNHRKSKCENSYFLKNQLFSFLSYLRSYLAYRGIQYLKLIVLRFYFDPFNSLLEPGWIFEEIRNGKSVPFFFPQTLVITSMHSFILLSISYLGSVQQDYVVKVETKRGFFVFLHHS